MGYWEDKQKYEEGFEQKELKKGFCNVCGRKLTPSNIKGKCVSCEEIICNSCGKVYKNKIICNNCKEENKTFKGRSVSGSLFNLKTQPLKAQPRGVIHIAWVIAGFFFYIIPGIILLIIRSIQLQNRNDYDYVCGNCRNIFSLEKDEIKHLNNKGWVQTCCPFCKRINQI
ncbi:hypothetical protein HYT57_04775 [Candidatus Woesearchaeota archaeon]|nr:hypothetical protein [Candidatus Woesearchaeota archaeon]